MHALKKIALAVALAVAPIAAAQNIVAPAGPVCLNPLGATPCSDSIWDVGGSPVFNAVPIVGDLLNCSNGTTCAVPTKSFGWEVGTCTLGTDCAITALTFSATPIFCSAQDTTAAAATKAVLTSKTTVTFTGTGTDVLVFACFGAK